MQQPSFINLKLDITIFVNMHSSCNINNIGKPELFENPFLNTKYPIKLSYNAAKPGITSYFNQELLTITDRQKLKEEVNLIEIYKKDIAKNYNNALNKYTFFKEKSDFLNNQIYIIIKLYFYNIYNNTDRFYYYNNEIKNENKTKYMLVYKDFDQYYLINNNLSINKLNKIINTINNIIKYINENNLQSSGIIALTPIHYVFELTNDFYLKIANTIYWLSLYIQHINEKTNEHEYYKNYFNSLRNKVRYIKPSNTDIANYLGYNENRMKYFNEPQFKRVTKLYKQTYIRNTENDDFNGGLYITFKYSDNLILAIMHFLNYHKDIANAYITEKNPAYDFFLKNLNNKLLEIKNQDLILFLYYLFEQNNINVDEISSILNPILNDNTLTSSELKLFIELIANNIGKCTVFNIACLAFENNEELDANRNALLTEQLNSVIIPSNEASPELEKTGGRRKTRRQKKAFF